jgi:adenine-specific DNA-methyltransferase
MTLNYIGSKKTLLPVLDYVICSNIEEKSTFGDLFAGTGIVGEYFSKKGFSVTANDTENYSYVINYATLISSYTENIKNIIETFKHLEGISGLIHKNYSPLGKRLFFTEENAKIADAVRLKIEELKNQNKINNDEYYFLISSLIQSIDKVANTTSVYGAFLKKFKESSLKKLVISPIHLITNSRKHNVIQKDILQITDKFDVAYLDPPYVARQYGANYCPLNFIVEYNDKIELKGKTGLYNYYKSPFASKLNASKAFEKMFETISKNCSHIFLSYNNNGILTLDELINIMKQYGDIITYKYSYKKFQASKTKEVDETKEVESKNKNTEYVHYLKCNGGNSIKTIQLLKIKKHIVEESTTNS